MSDSTRETLTLRPMADDPEVGRWLSAMEDARIDTLRELNGVTPDMIDARPYMALNSIGTLLYHIALVEADWLLDEILESTRDQGPSWLGELLPFDDRDGTGRLTYVDGQPLQLHLDRLSRVRSFLLDEVRPMAASEFHRIRRRPRYDVSPDWVLHHLLQHEAEHRAHIAWLRDSHPAT